MKDRERFLRNLQESMQLSSFMASLVLKAGPDLTFARRRYCVTHSPGLWAALWTEFRPWKMWKGHKETMGMIGTRTATRLNSPTGTRLALRQRGGGACRAQKPIEKVFVPRSSAKAAFSWAPADLETSGVGLPWWTSLLCKKEELWGHSRKRHGQGPWLRSDGEVQDKNRFA